MSPLAETLSRDDMMALALYFSQKRWPDLQQPPAPPDVAARAVRAERLRGGAGRAAGCRGRAGPGERLVRVSRLPPGSVPGRRHPAPRRRPIPGISPADDAGLP